MKVSKISLFLLLMIFSSSVFAQTTNKSFIFQNTKGQEFIFNEIQLNSFILKDKIKKNKKIAKMQALKGKKNSAKISKFALDDFFVSNSAFYEESCSSGDLSNYFMIDGKSELVIKGYDVLGSKDIAAEWLGIPSSGDMDDIDAQRTAGGHKFSSKISMAPEMKRWGVNYFVQKKLRDNFWFSILVPFVNVATNARLSEYEISGARPETLMPLLEDDSRGVLFFEEPLNVTQALSHPLMKYGKIDNKKHQKAGLADITLRLGLNKMYKKCLLDLYTQLVVPTGDKPTAEYLFEPIVGNGHHFAAGAGAKFSAKYKNFTLMSDFDYLYLFQSSEKRSFDLNNGPWSRYMAATTGLPRTRPQRLINYLTKDLYVTPGSYANALFAADFNRDKIHLQFGVNIEAKASEKVYLKEGFNDYVGIAFYDTHAPQSMIVDTYDTYNRTYSKADINDDMIVAIASADSSFTNIKESDLNLDSARSLNQLSVNPFVSVGFDGTLDSHPYNVSFGTFYKSNSNNKSIGSWGLWLNASISI
ncbi:hypothetical protein KJ644_04805 [Candidatus Dependentiae bacterium]|nr:hypothetical protein [Candidatus Dependentiae bacterium]